MARTEPTPHDTASQMSLMPLKKTTITLPLDLYKQLKIESAKSDKEMSAIVADALRKHLSEAEHAQQ
jgi:hypothetical protein